MLYISVQPDIPYFHWQIQVMLTNFREVGIDLDRCHVIFLHSSNTPSEQGLKLMQQFPTARFFFYKDERVDRSYIPSIKPYGMYKHFSKYNLVEQFFYHDSDIIFREKINEDLFKNKDIWYMSDTISYIGYEYCLSKGEDQLSKMADIVSIPLDTIKDNQKSSGGAQYIMSGATAEYWKKVYEDSDKLYKFLDLKSKTEVEIPGTYLIQKWCAEMWATLWNIWFFKHETQVNKELDFCFATAPISDYFKCKILHNAGVTQSDKDRMFFKGEFINKSPFEADLDYVNPNFCSYQYKVAVEKVGSSVKSN